jgi:hypothetical protein
VRPQACPAVDVALRELLRVGAGRNRGKHAADELQAFQAHGKPVSYFRANMNRDVTDEWCGRAWATIVDYRGAARAMWTSLAGGRNKP